MVFLCSLNYSVSGDDNVGDELLKVLTKFSPKSLTFIAISGDWKYSIVGLDRFFKSFRRRTLHYFVIVGRFYTDDYKVIARKYIKEGVIKAAYIGDEYFGPLP
jgi:hypothetical protein